MRPGVVLAEVSSDPHDPEYSALQENVRALRLAKDTHGRRLQVLTLTRPPWNPRWPRDFAASYVNFYLANGGVVMPEFGEPEADEAAKKVLAGAFPDRRVVGLRMDTIARRGGGIHCATQQQPAARMEVQS